MKNGRFIIKVVFIFAAAAVIGTVGYIKYVKPRLDTVFWAYMDSRFQDKPEADAGSQETLQQAGTAGGMEQTKGAAADIQTAETQSRKVNELTKNNKDLEGFSTIRNSWRYDIIDAKLTKEVGSSRKENKRVIIENGKIINGYTAVIITVDITNVNDSKKDMAINNNDIYFFDSLMKIMQSIEIGDIDNPMYSGKSYYKLSLNPNESIREVCYYYIEDELLEGDYIAQYTVNPCGHPLNYNVTPDYREYDYIVRYNLKDLLSMNENL